jgi:hypothetical protein
LKLAFSESRGIPHTGSFTITLSNSKGESNFGYDSS